MKHFIASGVAAYFLLISHGICQAGVTVAEVTKVEVVQPNPTGALNLSTRAEIKGKWPKKYHNVSFRPPRVTLLDIIKGEYMKVARRTLYPATASRRPKPKTMTPVCGFHRSLNLTHVPYRGSPKIIPNWELVLKSVICAALDLVAFLGNATIILIVIKTKKMRTTTNYYIVNLACSDLLVACGPIWIHLVDDLTEGWQLGYILCKFSAFLQSK